MMTLLVWEHFRMNAMLINGGPESSDIQFCLGSLQCNK